MIFQVSELPVSITCGVAGIAAIIVVIAKLWRVGSPNLDAIPTVGSRSGSLGAFWDGLNYNTNIIDAVQKGYDKHKSSPFKIYDLFRFRWVVVVSNPEHMEQVLRAPQEVLSLAAAIREQLNTRYILGRETVDKRPHIVALRAWLPRHIATLYHEIRDEISMAFDEELDIQSDEWKTVPALGLVRRVVCRTSNRLFVGLPLGRNLDWIDLNIQFTMALVKAGVLLGMFPEFMKPLAVHFFTSVNESFKRGLKNLGPIIEEQLKYIDEHGDDDASMPNDLLSWMLKNGANTKLTPELLTSVMLSVNFAGIHTTSTARPDYTAFISNVTHSILQSFTQALFYLAANPQYIRPMREEVESVVEKEGWSKESLGKMCKIDSFLRECQRFEGVSAMSVVRKALKDFTLSDGTFIPRGTLVGIPTQCIHREDRFYPDGNVFQPFRFVDKDTEDGGLAADRLASTATNYLVFGHGKQACPGRFLAASELKTMLAHVVVMYDIKLEDGATHPRSLHLGTSITVDPRAKVLFRRRVE